MKAEDLIIGECYLLPVAYTQEPFKGGNLVAGDTGRRRCRMGSSGGAASG